MNNAFKPHRYFKNRHLQTCLPTILSKFKKSIDFHKEQIHLDDGDSIELCFRGDLTKPCVFMLPGLEGDIESAYIQTIVPALNREGWCVVVMHYRSCGNSKSQRVKSYNSNSIEDAITALDYLKNEKHIQPKVGIGFSLGGNVLLHHAYRADYKPYEKVITVSAPFDMLKSAHYIHNFYEQRFLKSFKKKVVPKLAMEKELSLSTKDVLDIKSLYEFDDKITGPLWGFTGAEDYYHFSSCRPFLDKINITTHMIYAKDDPFIPENSMPLEAPSEYINLIATEKGGHVGFFTHKNEFGHRYWLVGQIVNLLASYAIK